MIKHTTSLLPALALVACSAQPIDRPDMPIDISGIRINPAAKTTNGQATVTRCSGFSLSEKEVHLFLQHAARIRVNTPDPHYQLLPCVVTGSAVLNNRRYQWAIHAGGVGAVTAGDDHFNLVCGKGCCDKVPGLC